MAEIRLVDLLDTTAEAEHMDCKICYTDYIETLP
jgi:hypothetical protein